MDVQDLFVFILVELLQYIVKDLSNFFHAAIMELYDILIIDVVVLLEELSRSLAISLSKGDVAICLLVLREQLEAIVVYGVGGLAILCYLQ